MIDKDIEIVKQDLNNWKKEFGTEGSVAINIKSLENVLSELEKKDNIIDLMSRAILNYDDQLVINKYRNKEEVKKYFEEITENEQFR